MYQFHFKDRVTKENMAKAMAMEAKLLNNMNAPVEEAAAVDENGDNKSEVVVAAA